VDFHERVSFPLPVLVICELLGVPYEDRDEFCAYSDQIADMTDQATSRAGMQGLFTYMTALVERKLTKPGGDVISDLIRAQQTECIPHRGDCPRGRRVALRRPAALCQRRAVRGPGRRDPKLVDRAVEEILRMPTPRPNTSHPVPGHRRLAVIDIEGGTQPMSVCTDDGTVTITYSGEVYNFTELRGELRRRGHQFRTRNDTEVVLQGYLEWGEAVAERLNGMYAFAIWDTRVEKLVMIRDRMGIKPFYLFPTSDEVLFGSEPKAILANPLAKCAVDLDGLRELLTSPRRLVRRCGAGCARCSQAPWSPSTAPVYGSTATGRCRPAHIPTTGRPASPPSAR
jgi:hypothetical protein